ncbi:peptidylprolyl isomerase [Patescibacteria group bacterium]|nr:peptidylprolyl isomerase [Patescibacteria group bacterium]
MGGLVLAGALVWAIPKGIIWAGSLKSISGPFGTLSREELVANKFATISTSEGDIKIELLSETAPKTVANFVLLTQKNFYDNVKFHRIIKDFMIQTGDPLSKDDDISNDGTGGPGYQFDDEFSSKMPNLTKGIVAMANSGVNTNGSQFFIITGESTPWLDGKHTPFGRVIAGLDIVDKIGIAKTSDNDRPKKDIIIKSVVLSNE